jgi:hypothetical protein
MQFRHQYPDPESEEKEDVDEEAEETHVAADLDGSGVVGFVEVALGASDYGGFAPWVRPCVVSGQRDSGKETSRVIKERT